SNLDLVNLIIMFSLLSHSLSIAKAKPAAKSSAEQLFRNCSFTASCIKAWPALTSSEEKTRRMARALSSADCVIGRPCWWQRVRQHQRQPIKSRRGRELLLPLPPEQQTERIAPIDSRSSKSE